MEKGVSNLFGAFFVLKPKEIKASVVISPILYPKHFGSAEIHKSVLSYLVADFPGFTFVKTPMTQSAVFDLVLLLKKTKCREVVFIGALGGLLKGLKIGDVVTTNSAKPIQSVSSIHEETRKNLLAWRRRGVVGIDFETKAFFAAAKKAKLYARARYVVTDLPLNKPFYCEKSPEEKARIQIVLKQLCELNG